MNAQTRALYHADPLQALINKARSRCKEKEAEFDITHSDFETDGFCPIFRTRFQIGTPFAMSIDRMDNTKSYVKGNVQLISRKANSMKSDASPEMLLMFADWIYRTYKD